MVFVRLEGSRDGPHLVKSSGGESTKERKKREELHLAGDSMSVQVIQALILTFQCKQVVSRFVAQLQPHDTRLHHDVIEGVEVTSLD